MGVNWLIINSLYRDMLKETLELLAIGPRNVWLNASYKTANECLPGGCLVFFPSYKLMGKCWRETGQWSLLNKRKSLFVEPGGGNQRNLGLY